MNVNMVLITEYFFFLLLLLNIFI